MAKEIILIQNVTTDQTGVFVEVKGGNKDEYLLEVDGTGTFTVELLYKSKFNDQDVKVRDASRNVITITAAESIPVIIPEGQRVAIETSGTSNADVSAVLHRLKNGRG